MRIRRPLEFAGSIAISQGCNFAGSIAISQACEIAKDPLRNRTDENSQQDVRFRILAISQKTYWIPP